MDPGEPVRIVHRNSIYGALVWEAFELDDQGFLRLVGIKTDRPAVLEYYGLEDSSSNWIPMDRKFACLTLRVTRSGGFWVFAGKETVPLSQRVADGSQVEISAGRACN
jgi:hypothetical protein